MIDWSAQFGAVPPDANGIEKTSNTNIKKIWQNYNESIVAIGIFIISIGLHLTFNKPPRKTR